MGLVTYSTSQALASPNIVKSTHTLCAVIVMLLFTVPSNFSHTVVDGDPHSVMFTWSPSSEPKNGEITHYTINCTSESGSDRIRLNATGLETAFSTFVPATHYKCSISVSTICGENPHSDAIDVLTGESYLFCVNLRYSFSCDFQCKYINFLRL